MFMRRIAELLTLVAYVWTIYIFFKISGLFAALLSMLFPFAAPLYGFIIYYFTGDVEIANNFIIPNVLNLLALICMFVTTNQSD